MTRRGFFAALAALPVAVKAIGKPEPVKSPLRNRITTREVYEQIITNIEFPIPVDDRIAVALEDSDRRCFTAVSMLADIHSIDLISGAKLYKNGYPVVYLMPSHGKIKKGDFLCLTKSGKVRAIRK